MSSYIYCVLDGPQYPEGAPDAMFVSLEEAKEYIKRETYIPENHCIYKYPLGGGGYEEVLNYIGEAVK